MIPDIAESNQKFMLILHKIRLGYQMTKAGKCVVGGGCLVDNGG